MRQLATIQRIIDITDIENADNICRAQVLGWGVVIKRDDFNVGDLVCFFEIDSVLPPSEKYAFLEKTNWRVKSCRLRGCLSQGLVLPLSILPETIFSTSGDAVFVNVENLQEGDDVTDALGIIKYEPPVSASLGGQIKGNFPGFLHKTDTDRIQSNTRLLHQYIGVTFIAHEKLDGSSMTVYYRDGEFGVCSRNLDIKESDDNSFWQVAKKYDLPNKLAALGNYSIQGELIGPGVQKNKYALKELDFRVFDVFDIDKGEYVPTDLGKTIAAELGLTWCPYITEYTFTENTTVDELLGLAEGKSALNPNQEREGLVFRPQDEMNDTRMGRLAFKTISNKFLLKCED